MHNHLLYFGYWIVNSFLFYIASRAIPDNVVKLGSWRFSSLESSLYAGFCLTFLVWVWWDFALARRFNFNKKFITFLFFIFVNCFSIWAISRFSYFTGVEVTNYNWIIVIGLAATILQRFIRRVIVNKGSFVDWM